MKDIYGYIKKEVQLLNHSLFTMRKREILRQLLEAGVGSQGLQEQGVEYKYYIVILIKGNYHKDYIEEHWNNDIDLIRFEMINIAERIMGTSYYFEALNDYQGKDVLIIGCDVADYNMIGYSCEIIQRKIKEILHIDASFGIGSFVDSIYFVNDSYKQSIKAMKHRKIYGARTIISIADVQQLSESFVYPQEIEDEIVGSFKFLDKEQCEKMLDEFLKYIVQFDIDSILLSMIRLFLGISIKRDIPIDVKKIYEEVTQLETLDEMDSPLSRKRTA